MNTLLTLSGESALVPTLADGNPNLPLLTQTAVDILHCAPRRIDLTDVGNDAFMAVVKESHIRARFLALDEWINPLVTDGCYFEVHFVHLDRDWYYTGYRAFTLLLHIDDLPPIPFHFIHYREQFTRIRTSELEITRPSKWSDDRKASLIETPEMVWFDSLETCLRADLRVDEYDPQTPWLSTGHSAELIMEPELDEYLSQCNTRFLCEGVLNELWQLTYAPLTNNPAHFWMHEQLQAFPGGMVDFAA